MRRLNKIISVSFFIISAIGSQVISLKNYKPTPGMSLQDAQILAHDTMHEGLKKNGSLTRNIDCYSVISNQEVNGQKYAESEYCFKNDRFLSASDINREKQRYEKEESARLAAENAEQKEKIRSWCAQMKPKIAGVIKAERKQKSMQQEDAKSEYKDCMARCNHFVNEHYENCVYGCMNDYNFKAGTMYDWLGPIAIIGYSMGIGTRNDAPSIESLYKANCLDR